MGEQAQATFGLNLDGNAAEVSDELATSLEDVRAQIQGSEGAIKEYSNSLRKLKGTTEEVKSAKAALKAKIDAERDAISASSLKILKHGTNYDKLAVRAKNLAQKQKELAEKTKADGVLKAKERAEAMSSAIARAGGPVSSLREKLGALNSIAGGSGGAMGVATLAAAGLAAAVLAVAAAATVASVSVVKFIFGSANAARTANLFREAASGSAQNAANLGTQVDELAKKLSTPKAKLNELGIELARTRLGGQTIVDTFNLVGQASDAMGDTVGNTLKDIVTRGQLTQRFQINPQELFGTGVDFQGVAGELAKQLGVGIKDAQAALFEGRVKLADGAKALRSAVEKRFGELNARKMLDLSVQAEKFKETLASLTKDVKLEPLLRAFKKIAEVFDESTVNGAALKQLVTVLGSGLASSFEAAAPIAKSFIQGLVIGGLEVAIAFYQVRNKLRETFGGDVLKNVDTLEIALRAGKVAAVGIAGAVVTVAAVAAIAVAPFVALYAIWDQLNEACKRFGKSIRETFLETDWKGMGGAIVDGLVNGLKAGALKLVNTVKGLAESVKGAFTGKLKIESPSKVFAEYGEHTTEGYAQGVESGSGRAQGAVEGMIATPKSGGGGSKASGGRGAVNLTIHVQGNNAAEVKRELEAPGFLDQLLKAIEEATAAEAVPAQ